jgi:hypothetical protein
MVGGFGETFPAESDHRNPPESHFVAVPLADCRPESVHLTRIHIRDRSAAVAGEVLALHPIREDVAPWAPAGLDLIHQAVVLEDLEIAIHGGKIEADATPVWAARDLAGR